jgi:hypothetical protein
LIARKTGKGKVSFALAGGSSYEIAIQDADGKITTQALQR